jgi:arabinogalactan oligomer/maltooligosaccharide transport system permease protein
VHVGTSRSAAARSVGYLLSRRFGPLFFAIVTLLISFPARAAAPIHLWHAYRGAEERALGEIVARFQDAPVEVLSVPYDAFGAKLAASIPLGEGPDLFIDAHERLGDYRARGLVAPVGDALEAQAFDAAALSAVRDGADAWAVPLSEKCIALYVNTALARDVPASLEAIAELRPSLPEGVFPLAYEAQGAYAHQAILAAFGGRMLGPGDQFAFVGDEAVRSLEFVKGMLAARAIPEDSDGALVTDLFRAGKAAFAISGPWLASDLGASGPRFRVVPLPPLRATGEPMRPFVTVESVMLSPKGAERAEVRALARLLAGPEASLLRAKEALTVPARIDVALPEDAALVRAFAEQAKAGVVTPSSRAMRAVWEPANQAIRKVLRGQMDAEPALLEAKHRFDDVRRPLPPPASPAPLAVLVGVLALFGAFHLVRRARSADVRAALRRSRPAYMYIVHAVVAVGVLVVLPLVVGAATSLFAGGRADLRYVGLANFVSILTARGGELLASGSFYLVLGVTVLWTVVNVFFHVTIGVALGLLLARPALRLRAAYRVLLIVPWAVPSYVTALAWKGMFHKQFGAVTGLLLAADRALGLHVEPIAWFSSFSTAFSANVATNVWLGFPFMMVVTIGALTAVPDDVLEAAEVDGATRLQRLRLVTLPMIKPALLPAVTLGAIWTFNMFNVVFLVSGGDPDGKTDILVSEAYRWAFTREAQYGYAAAYSVLIFVLLAGITRLLNRAAKPPVTPAVPAAAEGAS